MILNIGVLTKIQIVTNPVINIITEMNRKKSREMKVVK